MNLALLVMGSAIIIVMILHIIFFLMMINRAPGIISKIYSDDNTCKGLSGLILGHKYEEVFDRLEVFPEGLNPADEVIKIDPGHYFDEDAIGRLIYRFKEDKKIYVRHVCKKCGHVIHRGGN